MSVRLDGVRLWGVRVRMPAPESVERRGSLKVTNVDNAWAETVRRHIAECPILVRYVLDGAWRPGREPPRWAQAVARLIVAWAWWRGLRAVRL